MKLVHTLTLGASLVLGATILSAQAPTQPRAPQGPQGQVEGRDAAAKGPGMRGPRGRGMRQGGIGRGALLRGVELSEAQREQLRAIGERYRAQHQARMEQARTARGEPRVRPDSATRAAWRSEMLALRQQQEAEVRAVLTPEQQQTFDANRAQLAERVQAMRERRAERGEGGARGERPAQPRRGRGPGRAD